MTLAQFDAGYQGVIKNIKADDDTLHFLSSIGCAKGDRIRLISVLGNNYIVSVKDSRFALDRSLAGIIQLEQESCESH
ncbi:FeoA family protein [Guggenheimella bovis]